MTPENPQLLAIASMEADEDRLAAMLTWWIEQIEWVEYEDENGYKRHVALGFKDADLTQGQTMEWAARIYVEAWVNVMGQGRLF